MIKRRKILGFIDARMARAVFDMERGIMFLYWVNASTFCYVEDKGRNAFTKERVISK